MSFYSVLYILPKNWISYILGRIVAAKLPFGIHSRIKTWFIGHYHINLEECEFPHEHYPTLGAFFIRRLKAGARPIAASPVVSPVDGRISQIGSLQDGNIIPQIKDKDYSLKSLVASEWPDERFTHGGFATFYLAPFNYHRIHSPVGGIIKKIAYIPGALWPVNEWSVRTIDGLFTVNERFVIEIESEAGTCLMVLVGATNVGKIRVFCWPEIVGNSGASPKILTYVPENKIPIEKGAELGCFEMGSTVVLIGDSRIMEYITLHNPRNIQVGETLC